MTETGGPSTRDSHLMPEQQLNHMYRIVFHRNRLNFCAGFAIIKKIVKQFMTDNMKNVMTLIVVMIMVMRRRMMVMIMTIVMILTSMMMHQCSHIQIGTW